MKKIIWHLPYAIVGGVETLYATILKYLHMYPGLEHYVTCHKTIKNWVFFKYKGYAKIFPYSDIKDLSSAIKTIDPHLIMGTHGMTLYQALQSSGNYPVVEIVHGSHTWVEHNARMPKDWTKHVICVSHSAEKNYIKSAKDLKTSSPLIGTSIIINGVDTTVFYPRKPFQEVARNIGYFGRFLEEDKHLTKMIDAYRSLGSAPSRLYLIGGSPVEILRLRNHVKRKKITKEVLFFKHAEEPQKYYEELDMCTIRSQAEGYCNSAAEALASGTPLVCYDFGGILDHVPSNTIAVGKTQSEYAALLSRVFKDPQLRLKMRERGLQFVKEQGNAKVMADKYYKLINQFAAPMKVKTIAEPEEDYDISLQRASLVTNSDPTPENFLKKKKIVGVYTPYWHGIASATKNVTNAYVEWNSDYKKIVNNIIAHSPDAVLFSGLPEGFKEAATLLRQKRPSLPIYVYYHGGVSHFSFAAGIYGAGERNALEQILSLTKRGVFNKIAVSSPGLEAVGKVNKIPFVFCGNIVEPFPEQDIPQLKGLHIGNWNRHLDHKHTSVGLGASNLLPNSIIHMLECPYRIPSVNYRNVVFYKELGQTELYKKYQQMTMNLQLSFIETFNISVLEMWACGAPVVLGPGNYVLIENNSYLKDVCYVQDHTNPQKVAETIKVVLNERANVVSGVKKWLKVLNSETRSRWNYFFKG